VGCVCVCVGGGGAVKFTIAFFTVCRFDKLSPDTIPTVALCPAGGRLPAGLCCVCCCVCAVDRRARRLSDLAVRFGPHSRPLGRQRHPTTLHGVCAVCVRCVCGVCAVCVRCVCGVCAVCVRCLCGVCAMCVWGVGVAECLARSCSPQVSFEDVCVVTGALVFLCNVDAGSRWGAGPSQGGGHEGTGA
jgi:hypothetical protein